MNQPTQIPVETGDPEGTAEVPAPVETPFVPSDPTTEGAETGDRPDDATPAEVVQQSVRQEMPGSNPRSLPPVGDWTPANEVSSQRSFLDDALGGFDPEVHAVDKEGKPRLTAKGEFMRKPGRKKTAVGEAPRPAPSPEPASTPAPEPVNSPAPDTAALNATASMLTAKSSKEAAKMIAAMFVVGTSAVIGPEWRPTEKAEMKMLEEATENYLNSIGGVAMSPLMGLVCAYGMYSLPRVSHDNTQSKMGKAWTWVKQKTVRAYLWARGR